MGMYDELKCEYPLPEKSAKYQDLQFQTKSLGNFLDKYIISKDGELIIYSFDWEPVPEEDRPFYGKPEWQQLSWVGSFKSIPNEPRKIEHTGEVRFYSTVDNEDWIEFVAFFSKGKLIHIETVEENN
jgi:hypothetical protein